MTSNPRRDPQTATPAEKAIRAAGGVRPLATLLGIDHVWVWRWTRPCTAGGTDGRIPYPQQARIAQLSDRHGWGLTPADILGIATATPADMGTGGPCDSSPTPFRPGAKSDTDEE